MKNQVLDFFIYFVVGIILSCVFDVFRGYRKFKKNNNIIKSNVLLQDIIYFIIASFIIIITNIYILKCGVRFYLVISLITGIVVYINFFSKYFIKLYILIFNINKEIINFIFFPLIIIKKILLQIYTFFDKIIKKTCKFIKNMISYIMSRITKIFVLKKKGDKINEKKKVKKAKIKKRK